MLGYFKTVSSNQSLKLLVFPQDFQWLDDDFKAEKGRVSCFTNDFQGWGLTFTTSYKEEISDVECAVNIFHVYSLIWFV